MPTRLPRAPGALIPFLLIATGCNDDAAARPEHAAAPPPATAHAAANPVRRPAPKVERPARVESAPEPRHVAAPPADVDAAERDLFARHCAACHGETGSGDGALGVGLLPPPRNFGDGAFKLRSTVRGLPSDDDLARTIRRGMPGSAMPGAAHLSDADLATLVRVVRRLAYEGRVAALVADDPELTAPEAGEIAADLIAPGEAFEVPPRPEGPPESPPDRVFAFYCTECHADDGTAVGAVEDDLKDYAGRPTRARDLTREPLKGGDRPEDIIRRVALGMPGSPMPESTRRPDNLWGLADHVLALRAAAPDPGRADARVGSAAAAVLPLFPVSPDGRDPASVSAQLVESGGGVVLRVSWHAADAGAAAQVLVRSSAAAPGAFAWSADDRAWWGGERAADGAVEAHPAGDRFVAEIPLADASPAWLALAVREDATESSPQRAAFSSWHATD